MKKVLNDKGYVMLLAVVLAAIVVILSSAMFLALTTEIRHNILLEQKEMAAYVAQSGIEHGLSILEDETSPVRPTQKFIVINDGNITGEYLITELDNTHVKVSGQIRKNGHLIEEKIITAYIDSEGVVTYS